MSNSDSTMNTGTFELILEEYAGSAKMGYGRDPYENVPNVRDLTATARRTDLRALSEWIRARKLAEELKDSEKD